MIRLEIHKYVLAFARRTDWRRVRIPQGTMRRLFSKRRAAWRKGIRSKAVEKKLTNLGVCFVCYWGGRGGRC